ncbi:MAG: lipoyl synthase, partial [Kiritimatiellaeota bacterium]|nr:lipoyl synthase [Kiritimatiellota bacterium]
AAGRAALPAAHIEALTPDFGGAAAPLATVLAARPDVFNHNLETVRRLQPDVRPQASYERSLAVLRRAANTPHPPLVKSGLMAGLGETDEELREVFRDLRAAGCELLTLGQYLAPTAAKRPVARFVTPAAFAHLAADARALGFRGVAAGPLVRSSYRAEDLLNA